MSIKDEFITLKKKIGSLQDMHPLTLNIETINSLSSKIKAVSTVDENGKPT